MITTLHDGMTTRKENMERALHYFLAVLSYWHVSSICDLLRHFFLHFIEFYMGDWGRQKCSLRPVTAFWWERRMERG